MTPEEFKAKMLECDNMDVEHSYSSANAIICDLLKQLGYSDGAEVFAKICDNVERWLL